MAGRPHSVGSLIALEEENLVTTPDFELSLPARAENVAVVRHALGGIGETFGVSDQVLSDIKLAVTEACTNVVVHAYPDGEGPMEVSVAIGAGEVSIVVGDEGCGILPRADSPGLGLGLPLIASLADAVELGTADNERTEVRMTFQVEQEAA